MLIKLLGIFAFTVSTYLLFLSFSVERVHGVGMNEWEGLVDLELLAEVHFIEIPPTRK